MSLGDSLLRLGEIPDAPQGSACFSDLIPPSPLPLSTPAVALIIHGLLNTETSFCPSVSRQTVSPALDFSRTDSVTRGSCFKYDLLPGS